MNDHLGYSAVTRPAADEMGRRPGRMAPSAEAWQGMSLPPELVGTHGRRLCCCPRRRSVRRSSSDVPPRTPPVWPVPSHTEGSLSTRQTVHTPGD